MRPIGNLDRTLASLMRLGYRARRRWLRRGVWSSKHPRRLYKYRAVEPGNQQSVDELRDMVVESLLWMSSPEGFNDPADLQATWVIEGSAAELRTRISVLVKELEPANVLMWSHYANRHEGMCLQYEFARDVPVLARALHVDYLEEAAFQPIKWVHAKNMRDAIADTLTRKHKRWEYEGEHRILLDGQAGTYLPVRPEALSGLILGCHATEAVRGTISNLLSEREARGLAPVKLWQAHMDGQTRIHIRAASTAG